MSKFVIVLCAVLWSSAANAKVIYDSEILKGELNAELEKNDELFTEINKTVDFNEVDDENDLEGASQEVADADVLYNRNIVEEELDTSPEDNDEEFSDFDKIAAFNKEKLNHDLDGVSQNSIESIEKFIDEAGPNAVNKCSRYVAEQEKLTNETKLDVDSIIETLLYLTISSTENNEKSIEDDGGKPIQDDDEGLKNDYLKTFSNEIDVWTYGLIEQFNELSSATVESAKACAIKNTIQVSTTDSDNNHSNEDILA